MVHMSQNLKVSTLCKIQDDVEGQAESEFLGELLPAKKKSVVLQRK